MSDADFVRLYDAARKRERKRAPPRTDDGRAHGRVLGALHAAIDEARNLDAALVLEDDMTLFHPRVGEVVEV